MVRKTEELDKIQEENKILPFVKKQIVQREIKKKKKTHSPLNPGCG